MLQPKKLGNQRRQNDSARRRGYPSRVTTVQERRGQNMASALICRAMSFFFEKGMNSLALHASGAELCVDYSTSGNWFHDWPQLGVYAQ
jgi:hypothetical protein